MAKPVLMSVDDLCVHKTFDCPHCGLLVVAGHEPNDDSLVVLHKAPLCSMFENMAHMDVTEFMKELQQRLIRKMN